MQLQEFRHMKRSLKKTNADKHCDSSNEFSLSTTSPKRSHDRDDSSQDESSFYGSCGYFIRFSEKSSPFENLFDQRMIEEDILSGIADETSCYFSEDSSENENENNIYMPSFLNNETSVTINNSSLNLLRIIGRYLQMCSLIYAISGHIINSMKELIDCYCYSVYIFFSKDLLVQGEALHSTELLAYLKRIESVISMNNLKLSSLPNSIQNDLQDPEQFFGLSKRVNAVESCATVMNQFFYLSDYLIYLIGKYESKNEHFVLEQQSLLKYIFEMKKCVNDMRKPVYACITSRAIDIQHIMSAMGKVKWDIPHLPIQHNSYIDVLNRVRRYFFSTKLH